MGHFDFQLDLAKARMNEVLCASIMAKRIDYVNMVSFPENRRECDFILNIADPVRGVHQVAYECKEDFKCQDTNNVAIELESRGKPSGLSTTLADYWVITAHYTCPITLHRIAIYVVDVRKLHEIVEDTNLGRTTFGGDEGSNTKIFLTSRHRIEEAGELVMDTDIHSYDIMVMLCKQLIEEVSNG